MEQREGGPLVAPDAQAEEFFASLNSPEDDDRPVDGASIDMPASTQISMAGRFLVYLPQESHIGISQRIEDEEERAHLREKLQQLLPPEEKGGFIIRTMAETASDRELYCDIAYLRKLWHGIQERARDAPALALLTLALLSYLIADNPLYRIAVHLFIGLSAGYAVVLVGAMLLERRRKRGLALDCRQMQQARSFTG